MRGLCLVCYSRAKKLVDARATTWDEIVGMGLATVEQDADPFTEAYNRIKEEKYGVEGRDAGS